MESCVPTARAMMTVFKHPERPLEPETVSDLDIGTTKADDFNPVLEVFTCDKCGTTLWSAGIYRLKDAGPDDALCKKCSVGLDVTEFKGTSVPLLTLNKDSPEAKWAIDAAKQSGRSLVVFEALRPNEDEIAVEVLDPKLPADFKPIQMYGSLMEWGEGWKNKISTVLSKLRRQRSNGMMGGLICLRFWDPVAAGNKLHAMNFLVGPGARPEVFFVDVCANNKKDRYVWSCLFYQV